MTAELHRAPLVDQLRTIVGPERVLDSHSELLVYECDAFTLEKGLPQIVVFPETAAEIARIVKLCNEHGVPFMPRGAGTSLSGGTAPVGGGVILALAKMNAILEVNLRDRY